MGSKVIHRIIVAIMVGSCLAGVGWILARRMADPRVECAKQFRAIYPDSIETIVQYKNVAPTWQGTIGLQGRFVLTMVVDVKIDPASGRAEKRGDLSLVLQEVESVELENGVMKQVVYNSKNVMRFGEKDWVKLMENNGNIASLGVVTEGKPVEGFEKAWRGK